MKLYQSLLTFTVSLYLVSWIPLCKASDECKRLSSLGKALKGHTFERFKANCPTDCIIRCEKELRCQSYNYVLEEKICELNNRTNEARPVDFKNDPARIYITIQFHRVPLGSIPELPGESCEEIEASEGKLALCKNWLKPNNKVETTLTNCYLEKEVYRMVFPARSTANYAMKTNAVKNDLNAFTLCAFIKSKWDPDVAYQTPTVYSYATSNTANEIYLDFSPTIHMCVDDEVWAFNSDIQGNKWQYICITWRNTNGSYQLYMDGQLTDRGTGLKTAYVITQGGTVVLGQDQDTMGGYFEDKDAFGDGQLAELNMWDRVLSEREIAGHYQDCQIPQGNVHAWSDFKAEIHGAVRVTEP